jgi:uncharacterized protein (DUF1778 family)
MATQIKKRRKRVVPSKSGITQFHKTVYLYPDEMEIVEAAADARGISVSAYMVEAALERAMAFAHSQSKK